MFSDLLECIHDISAETALRKGLFVSLPADKYTLCICAMRRDWIAKNTVLLKNGPISKNLVKSLTCLWDYPQKLGLSKFYKITKLYNLNLEVFENTAVIARVISHRNTRKGVMVVCTLDARYSFIRTIILQAYHKSTQTLIRSVQLIKAYNLYANIKHII